MSGRLMAATAMALAGAALGAPVASADTNGPTTRDCSLLVPALGTAFPGIDPDSVELSGVTVNPDGTLSAGLDPVSLKASESSDPGDGGNTVSFTATVSAPGVPDQTFSGTGTGSVTFSFPLNTAASGSDYTISWAATFDNGFHACPGTLTPANQTPAPFVVKGI